MAFDTQGFTVAAKSKGYSQPQIDAYIQAKGLAPEPKSVGGFVGNVFGSGAHLIGGVASAVLHPIQTTKALGSIALGGVQKAIPGRQKSEDSFDALISFFKERYGSVEALGETLYKDPVGALADLSVVAGGAGLAAKGLSFAGKADIARLAVEATKTGRRTMASDIAGRNVASRAAQTLQTVSQVTNPLAVIGTVGKITEKATKGRTIAPFGRSFKPGTAAIATERGVQLPASALSKSPAVGILESFGARGFFGQKTLDIIEAAGHKLNLIANQAIQKIGATTNLSEAGRLVVKGRDAFVEKWRTVKNDLYKKAELGGTKIEPRVPKTVATIERVIADKAKAEKGLGAPIPDKKFFENLLKGLTNYEITRYGSQNAARLGAGLTVDEALATLRQINLMIKDFSNPVSTGNQAVLKQIAALLESELDDSLRAARPDLAKALDAANAYYQEGITKLNSAGGKKISQYIDQPDLIAESLITGATSVDDIPRIYEMIGPEATKAIQATFLEKFFESARGKVGGNFTPGGLTTQIQKFGEDALKAILTPEQFTVVKDLEKLSKALGKGQGIATGSQTCFIGRLAAEMTAIAVNPLLAFKMVLSDVAYSKFIQSEVGQKLLTSGVELGGATGRGIQRSGAAVKPLLPVERATESQKP